MGQKSRQHGKRGRQSDNNAIVRRSNLGDGRLMEHTGAFERALQIISNNLRCHGRAVMKYDIITQGKVPDQPVFFRATFTCQHGDKFPVTVNREQSFHDLGPAKNIARFGRIKTGNFIGACNVKNIIIGCCDCGRDKRSDRAGG